MAANASEEMISARVAVLPAKLLKDGDQFIFIVHRIESQSKLGDQVMSVDEIGHG